MKNEQIVFTRPNHAELLEKDIPSLKENDLLVKTAFSTISSGTEKANITGDVNIGIQDDLPKTAVFPRTSGYSSSGVVIDKGAGVSDIEIGDRVVMSWSSHSKYNIIDKRNAVRIADASISMREAALIHIAIFPIAAVRKTRLEIGESALIMGLGILGLMSVQFARAAGAVPVIAADPIKERRDKAVALGADYALDPFEPDFSEKIKDITGGGANTAIEVTGIGAGLNQCLDCMARFGRIALLGCTRDKNFTVDYYKKVHGPGITIIGAHTLARPEFESHSGYFTQRDDIISVIKLLSGHRIDFKAMLDKVYSPHDCNKVYTQLINDKNFPIVVQFDWESV